MKIRTATMADLTAITAAEAASFPAAEAADRASFEKRLQYYPSHFWLLEDGDGALVSFINGLCTDRRDLTDDMYDNADLHDENGAWQMIFGVVTVTPQRRRGHAAALMREVTAAARRQGRRGLVPTCKRHMLPFYAALGFKDEGISASTHGGVVWHQMRLEF